MAAWFQQSTLGSRQKSGGRVGRNPEEAIVETRNVLRGLVAAVLIVSGATMQPGFANHDPVVLFDFESDAPDWRAKTLQGGRATVEQVRDETQPGNHLLRLRNEGGKRTRFSTAPELSGRLAFMSYRGISVTYRARGAPQRVGISIQANDSAGAPGRFATRLFAQHEQWTRVEFTSFWSKTKRPPDLGSIKLLSFGVADDIVLELDRIALIPTAGVSRLQPARILFVSPAAGPPGIDGELSDECWREAAGAELRLEDGTAPEFPTTVSVTRDAATLYVAARQMFPADSRPKADVAFRNGPVWTDDVFEVFLDPAHTHKQSLYFAVNAVGAVFDSRERAGIPTDAPWRAATKQAGPVCTVEMAIPFAALGVPPPKPGDSWGVNFKRILHATDGAIREHTASATLNGPEVGNFGDLVFCSAGSATARLDPFELFVPKPGVFRFLAPAKELTGAAVGVLTLGLPGEATDLVHEAPLSVDGDTVMVEATARIKETGQARARLSVLDETRGRVLAYANGAFAVSVPVQPLAHDEILLWPRPRESAWGEGRFTLGADTALGADGGCPAFPVTHFADTIAQVYGLRLRNASEGDAAPIRFGIAAAGRIPAAQGFTLQVGPARINVRGADETGLYYGVRTLLSLIEQSTPRGAAPAARCVTLRDWPDQPDRVLFMRLDWGYRASISVESMQDFIYRSVAGNRYNALILNCRGAVRYRNHPEIAQDSAVSLEDMARLAEFGRRHYLDVIPGGNCPGHAGWIVGPHPELREDGDHKTLCTSHPDALPLVFELYDDLCEIMPSKYFHVGHDEVRWKTEMVPEEKRCKLCAGKPKAELFLAEVKALRDHFKAKGRRVMMWNDMLIPGWNGGAPHDVASIRDRIPRDVIMMPWGRVGDPIRPFADLGFTVFRSHTGFNQGRFDDFAKDYECISGDGMAIFSKTPWLTFIHIPDRQHSNYHFLTNAIAGAAAWNKSTAERPLTRIVAEWGNHIARRHRQVPRTHASGTFRTIDLAPVANLALSSDEQGGWFAATDGRDLRSFPTGETSIAGIPFRCSGRGCAPETNAVPLPVNERINAFVVMHTVHVPGADELKQLKRMVQTAMSDDRGLVVGAYVVEYADGNRAEFPIRLGYNVQRWDVCASARHLFGSRWTWTGGTPKALQQDPYAADVGVQQAEFLNPYPDKTVAAITVANSATPAQPVLLALTVELRQTDRRQAPGAARPAAPAPSRKEPNP